MVVDRQNPRSICTKKIWRSSIGDSTTLTVASVLTQVFTRPRSLAVRFKKLWNSPGALGDYRRPSAQWRNRNAGHAGLIFTEQDTLSRCASNLCCHCPDRFVPRSATSWVHSPTCPAIRTTSYSDHRAGSRFKPRSLLALARYEGLTRP